MPRSRDEKYLEIYTKDDPVEIKSKGILTYRTKTIKSGEMLESESYPVWLGQRGKRKKKGEGTRRVQKNLNDKNAKKQIIRLINANFTEKDIMIGLSYRGSPPGEEQARKDIQNYIRRVRDFRRKNAMDELKYIYVMEHAAEGKKTRIHHHIIMSGMDRDKAEELWGKGYANSKRLQPDEFGLEGIARYIMKDPRGEKRWCCSKNLKKPIITVSDHKLSKRKAHKLAMSENEAKEVFEKMYPGYTFNDISIKFSDMIAGAYLYCRMIKKNGGADG